MSFNISYTFEAIDQFSSVSKHVRQQMDAITARAQKVQNAMHRVGQQMGKLGRNLTVKATAPLVGFGILAAKTYTDFEATMNMVAGVTNASGKQLKAYTKLAIDMGSQTQFRARQAAEAIKYLSVAHLNLKQVTAALPKTLELAASAQLDMGTAAKISATILRAFHMQVNKLADANNILVKTFVSTNTNLLDLSQAFVYVAGYAHSAGFSFAETAAALGEVAQQGLTSTKAGAMFRQAIVKMINPTKAARNVMKQANLQFSDAHGHLFGMTKILKELVRSGITLAGMQQIFGVRGGTFMTALKAQGLPALKALQYELEHTGNIAQRVAQSQMKGLVGAKWMLASAWEHLQIVLGKQFEPQLISLYNSLRMTILSFANASKGTKKWMLVIAGAVAAAGPFLIVLGKVILGLKVLAKLGLAPDVLMGVGIALKFLWRRLLGPIGALITLGSLLVYLYKKFKVVRDVVHWMGTGLRWMGAILRATIYLFKELAHAIEWAYSKMKTGVVTIKHEPAILSKMMPAAVGAAAPIASKILSALDINVHDPQKVIKSIKGKSAGNINVNVGHNMAASR